MESSSSAATMPAWDFHRHTIAASTADDTLHSLAFLVWRDGPGFLDRKLSNRTNRRFLMAIEQHAKLVDPIPRFAFYPECVHFGCILAGRADLSCSDSTASFGGVIANGAVRAVHPTRWPSRTVR